MLPYFHEIILVDVALMIIGTDVGTGGDGTIHQDRTYRYAGLAGVEIIAYVALIIAHEALARSLPGACPAVQPSPCSRFHSDGNAGCSAGYTPRKVGARDAPPPSADRVFGLYPMPSGDGGIKIQDLSYDYFFFFILPLAVTS